MALAVLTAPDDIRPVLDRFVTADPVRATVVATIMLSLGEGAWAAVDGDLLAVRSDARGPVAIVGRWTGAARAELLTLLAGVPEVRGFTGLVDDARPLIDTLGADAVVMEQRLFRCDDLVPAVGVDGFAVVADTSYRGLARSWVAAFSAEAAAMGRDTEDFADQALDDGLLILWIVGSEPMSMAARRPVLGGSARVGPVYPPPGCRGRGYGSAVTSAATRSILDEGAIPVLFTDLANPTSNKIYPQLGYRPVEDRLVGLRR